MYRHIAVLLRGMVVALAATSVQGQVPLAPEPSASPRAVAALVGADPGHVYHAALTGFAAPANPGRAEVLLKNPSADDVEQDVVVSGTSTPLTVSVSCYQLAGYCEAYASGGSGSGYSFTWGDAIEQYNNGGYSYAYPDCYPGYFLVPTAGVTDSNGAGAIASDSYYCFGGGGIEP